MRYIVILLAFISLSAKAQQVTMHCGYDFTSYLVLDVHEDGKKENIKNLKITVVDSLGREVINVGNVYSWSRANEPMRFKQNYPIGDDNKALPEGTKLTGNERWFFPYAKDNYILSIANTFPADRFSFKIEDVDGKENGGQFKTIILPLYAYNMYVLCSNESQQAAIKFGRKMNKPIDVVLEEQ
ncbi:hypothetical protein ACLI1A_06865 [Flavobacterium sp. RHBU_3]|uniref:hypothetical protein n=1 Tax=Flavobacterium sp. RHBU_3 TaxID=3391184 RepID=UPI0039851419